MNKYIYINIILLFFTVKSISQTSNKLDVSTNGNYKIVVEISELPDNVRNLKYYLINNDIGDTLYLFSCKRRDFPNPNFYWTNNNNLIFEHPDIDNNKIQVINLQTKKIIFSTNGIIPIPKNYSNNFYDSVNNLIFYFNEEKNEGIRYTYLMKLDINKLTVSKIMTFKTNFEIEFPLIKLDTNEKVLSVRYENLSANKEPYIYNEKYKY